MQRAIKGSLRLAGALILAAAATPALAVEAPSLPDVGRYLPLYPGLYLKTSFAYDPRDQAFDADGDRRGNVLPNFGGDTKFPQKRLQADWQWYFPLFESKNWPFISSRLFTARATLRGAFSRTEGSLKDFVRANGLEKSESGFGDLTVQFGSFLLGSENWKTRADTPYALLALIGVDVPTGEHDADSPDNAGTNQVAFFATLGGHWRPLSGWFLDGGVTYKDYHKNEDPAFGRLEPSEPGDLLLADFSAGTHVGRLFFGAFAQYQHGRSNLYDNPRFSTNPPPPDPGMENFPAPGRYRDQGTRLFSAGGSIRYFLTQDVVMGLHVIEPVTGKSGDFVLPFDEQAQGCRFSDSCMPMRDGSTVQDGFGAARSFASPIFMFTLDFSVRRARSWF